MRKRTRWRAALGHNFIIIISCVAAMQVCCFMLRLIWCLRVRGVYDEAAFVVENNNNNIIRIIIHLTGGWWCKRLLQAAAALLATCWIVTDITTVGVYLYARSRFQNTGVAYAKAVGMGGYLT